MKKLEVLAVLLFCLNFSQGMAQSREFKPFKVDFGITTLFPTSGISGNGMGMYFNPMFNLTDKFSVGPRMQLAYTTEENKGYISSYLDGQIINLYSLIGVSDFYFSKERARFFAGLGFGFYGQVRSWTSAAISSLDFNREPYLSVGLAPRFGFNVGHFKMSIQYNITGPSMYNYLDFTLGLEIGGGRYK